MSSRSDILGNIRQSLGRGPLDAEKQAALRARLSHPERGIQPDRVPTDSAGQAALFESWAETVNASIAHISTLDDIPDAIGDYLTSKNLPSSLRMAEHDSLKAVPWSKRPTLDVDTGPSDGAQSVGLSAAYGAVAETGTLIMHSGPQSPTTLNFLPANHIVLLRRSDIAGSYEDIWARLRAENDGDEQPIMPRTLNMITGPSRTGDIEQTIYLGAHGPLNLHILILDDDTE